MLSSGKIPAVGTKQQEEMGEADSIGGTLTLLYRVVGTGTDLLSAVRAGQALDVMGPIGTPFPVEGEQAILVAGGMGAAPLCMLARALHDAATRPMTCAERRCGPTGQYTPPMRAKAAW